MKVSAVVVRWRGGEEIDRCLRSLIERGGPTLGRIVLVDSGSGDGGAERLAAAFPKVTVEALAANRSFAHAANIGVQQCSEEFVFLLNPDTEIESGALDTLAAELGNRPEAAGVVPLLVNLDGSSQHRWQLRHLPSPERLAVGLPGKPAFKSPPASVEPVAQPAAAAWLLRRSAWDTLGGLDPQFQPAWWEDVDFCARLAGSPGATPPCHSFLIVPAARVRHLGGSSVREIPDAIFLATYFGNLLRYAHRHETRSFGLISRVLPWSLVLRSVIRPARRSAYLDVAQALTRTAQIISERLPRF